MIKFRILLQDLGFFLLFLSHGTAHRYTTPLTATRTHLDRSDADCPCTCGGALLLVQCPCTSEHRQLTNIRRSILCQKVLLCFRNAILVVKNERNKMDEALSQLPGLEAPISVFNIFKSGTLLSRK